MRSFEAFVAERYLKTRNKGRGPLRDRPGGGSGSTCLDGMCDRGVVLAPTVRGER
jgi:hypothetical protein